MSVVPFAWKDRPSLIEHILPAQKISAEAQKERKAGSGQTLTALGSYWKGRKPLILVKACVLGALLPATDDTEADLAVFEKLMAIDDAAFLRRGMKASALAVFQRLHELGRIKESDAEKLFVIRRKKPGTGKSVWEEEAFTLQKAKEADWGRETKLDWRAGIDEELRRSWELRWVQSFEFLERVGKAERPEQIEQEELFEPVWDEVNDHLGTKARSMAELVEQMGVLRFGRRPKVGDTFCGGGSIPFEAARLGCDAYASDLNPIACMLTWGALNIVGADDATREKIQAGQRAVAEAVDLEITDLGIEHDAHGNRAKVYLYCLETRCPQTGWMVPMSPSWVISKTRNVIARLVPDHRKKRFVIDIIIGVSEADMETAAKGTVHDKELVYTLDGETYRTPIKTLRGDYRLADGSIGNRLRRWEKTEFMARPEDIFQERLYAIQWITKETLGKSRQETFFAAVRDEDSEREKKVDEIVRKNLARWQDEGLVPDMAIEPGAKTDEPIRTRGWTHWHHLFNARQLLCYAFQRRKSNNYFFQDGLAIAFCRAIDYANKLNQWAPTHEKINNLFYNQALNPLFNYGIRGWNYFSPNLITEANSKGYITSNKSVVDCLEASKNEYWADFFITDPPYADAVNYEEITEFFIAWLRKNPPAPFKDWVWDSRRSLAVKGSGEDFRRNMIDAYRAMAQHMPDNGLQIVMFTHQDASVWADMTAIVWGAGLQVTAAWYIATETTSELKKGCYVQGTVLLVLRKRLKDASAYRDELVEEVRQEVATQIETMVGLNQRGKGQGRSENLFEDADLQMAGYAAALRVLTGYRQIDGQDMAAEALRPRQKGERDIVREIIDYAVQVANEHLVPEGVSVRLWERCVGAERFYLKMVEMEAVGLKKLDNYQNFAKAFRVVDYSALMGSLKANDARLKRAVDFKKADFDGDFGKSPMRAVLFALFELQREVEIDEVMAHLRDLVPGYMTRREDLMAICQYLAARREVGAPDEAQAARVLFARIKNERLGG
jgi:putative DNA methylase